MNWIMSANKKVYDFDRAFMELEYIFWRQNRNYAVGDHIYIYSTVPDQKIKYRAVVLQTDIMYSSLLQNDNKYFVKRDEVEEQIYRKFMKIKIIDKIDSELVDFSHLKDNGLNARIQGGMKVPQQLLTYIEHVFNLYGLDYNEVLFPGEIPNNTKCIEGAKKLITVNKYERDKNARRQCINHYRDKNGRISCQICGFDFGDYYGEEYNDIIHVHHIRELSSIGESYEVNPIKDLIPVCPNCHMVLHSSVGEELEDLKERLKNDK